MSLCQQCGLQNADLGLLCKSCIEGNRARHSTRLDRAAILTEENIKGSRTANNIGGYIKAAIAAIFALVVLQKMFGVFGYGRLAYAKTNPSSTAVVDPCAAKRVCFIAFVSPWCPTCHGAVPFLQGVRRWAENKSDVGVQLVVGADEAENLLEMGQQIGEPYYTDNANLLAPSMPGRGVPRWVVIDAKRNIINYGAGLPSVSEDHPGFENYLTSKIGLK